MDDSRVALSELIAARQVTSQFPEGNPRDFVPDGALIHVLSKDAIRRELEDDDYDDDDELVDFIYEHALKVFAIVVRHVGLDGSTLRKAMKLFKNGGFTDEALPVEPQQLDTDHSLAAYDTRRGKRIWTYTRVDNFCKGQWMFLAPVLRTATEDNYNHDFHQACILPFTTWSEIGSDRGAFGQVHKYGIHPDHLLDPPNSARCEFVAVKKMQRRNERDGQATAQGWEHEASVLQRMNALQHDHIVRFITAFRHGDPGNENHYLVFEWADGSNLLNLWKTPNNTLTPQRVRAAVEQLCGLANALYKAHEPANGLTFRHGDLKPANILWFRGSGDPGDLGMLKIADWGLAKQHAVVTELRSHKTSTEYGTRRYEPPEEETGLGVSLGSAVQGPGQRIGKGHRQGGNRRSRLYDIWAMGCISLEFIIWLLYGPRGLAEFNKSLRSEHYPSCPFYEIRTTGGIKVACVHPVVELWMDHMAEDPRCKLGDTALGDLLELVRQRLLVVDLPARLGTSEFPGQSAPTIKSPPRRAPRLGSPVTPERARPAFPAPPDTPVSPDSADIPTIVVSEPEAPPALPSPSLPPSPESFHRASGGRALAAEFVMRMENIYLEDSSDSYWLPDVPGLPFPQEGVEATGRPGEVEDSGGVPDTSSRTAMPGRPLSEAPPMLTITTTTTSTATTGTTGSRLSAPVPERIDYGKPELDDHWERTVDNEFAARFVPVVGQTVASPPPKLCSACRSFRDALLRPAANRTYHISDLQDAANARSCDLCTLLWHASLRVDASRASTILVERKGSVLRINSTPALALLRSPNTTTTTTPDIDAIQISHPYPHTTPLPAQFALLRAWLAHCDATHPHCKPLPLSPPPEPPTRLLAVGRAGDAHIRLTLPPASSRPAWLALSHQWGPAPHFATRRSNLAAHLSAPGIPLAALPAVFRDAVRVTRELGYEYLWIDSLCIVQGAGGDFAREATRMEAVYSGADKLAAFLGDPHFPRILLDAQQGERILRCLDLFKLYSHLELSNPADRPYALDGLQSRIMGALNSRGGFGVLDEGATKKGLLRRSLLWHRDPDMPRLERVVFPAHRAISLVPSWSWMAYTGGIDYLEIEFAQVVWDELESPWSGAAHQHATATPFEERRGSIALVAMAWEYDASKAPPGEAKLVFDTPGLPPPVMPLCVPLGRDKSWRARAYLLLVRETSVRDHNGSRVYERVGAGYLPAGCLGLGRGKITIR